MHIYTFDRKVSADFTFRLAGRSYPAPGFEAGQIIVVSPIARTNDVLILGTRESIPNGDGVVVQPITESEYPYPHQMDGILVIAESGQRFATHLAGLLQARHEARAQEAQATSRAHHFQLPASADVDLAVPAANPTH